MRPGRFSKDGGWNFAMSRSAGGKGGGSGMRLIAVTSFDLVASGILLVTQSLAHCLKTADALIFDSQDLLEAVSDMGSGSPQASLGSSRSHRTISGATTCCFLRLLYVHHVTMPTPARTTIKLMATAKITLTPVLLLLMSPEIHALPCVIALATCQVVVVVVLCRVVTKVLA